MTIYFFFQEHSKMLIPTHSISALSRGILKRLVDKKAIHHTSVSRKKEGEKGQKREIQTAGSVSPHMHLGLL